MQQIPTKIIRQLFVLLLILGIGSLIFREMLPYLTGVLGAVTLYILLRKWMAILVDKKKWGPSLSAILLMVISFFGILIPIAGIALMLGNKIGHAVQNSEQFVKAVKEQMVSAEQYVGFEINSVQVYGLTGRIVFESNPNTSKENINTANFTNGVYYVRIGVNNNFITKKLEIIQ